MKREIKFRAWNPNSQEIIVWESMAVWSMSALSCSQVMQFTGLKDKNGKEIYEGDILNVCNGSINGMGWLDKPYTVEYILNRGFNLPMYCWHKNGDSIMDSTHNCEVIGNIYENPELNNQHPVL